MERFLKSRYTIGEKISENPFTVTYKGYFIGTTKPVIIKIYKRGTLNSNLIKRMKQKVKEFSLIDHPAVAKLIDGDYGWQGFYYVREYIEGSSLQQVLESGQEIDVDKVRAIIEEVSQVLELAHSKGIIHGGLKPSNIFVDSEGSVKVADFVIEGEIKESMPQKAQAIMNNGKYLSPEELIGNPASASSDIYALGIVLCEAALKGGIPGLTKLDKLKAPTPLSREALAPLPRYLQDIVGKALQTDPKLRFSSAAELRESLEKKNLMAETLPHEEFMTLFENTVTQYGGEELGSASEPLNEIGGAKRKEKKRNWVLALVLGASLLSGLLYAFLFAR